MRRTKRSEDDFGAELQAHLDLEIERLTAEGASPEEARAQARRALGNLTRARERFHESQQVRWAEDLWRDLRSATRALAGSPAFTIVTIVTLGLGTAVSAAMFSVIDHVLLRPLPYQDSDRLVWVWSTSPQQDSTQHVSYPDLLDWRARSRTLEDFVGFGGLEPILTGRTDPERLVALLFSGDLFGTLRVAPLAGTAPRDAGDGAVAISYGLWQRVFGADPNVLGRPITLSGTSYTVGAIMPRRFRFPVNGRAIDVWIPLARFNPALADKRDARLIEVLARLKPGVTLGQAQADMSALAAGLSTAHPDTNEGVGVRVVSAVAQVTGTVSGTLWLLFAAAGCVLAVMGVNVASLVLARHTARRQELMLRAALGASRLRIGRCLLTESLALWAAGGLAGALLATAGMPALAWLLPPDLPRAGEIQMDAGIFGVVMLASLLAGAVFGLIPAWRASDVHPTTSLREALVRPAGRPGRERLGNLMVVAQIAAAVVLVTTAALLLNSFVRLRRPDPEFDPHHVLTFEVNWPSPRYTPAQAAQNFRELRARLLDIPGVVAASVGLQLPDRGAPPVNDDRPVVEAEGNPDARQRTAIVEIQSGYFEALGIPLRAGREFDDRDGREGRPVAIVNESLARTYWPDEDAIGRRVIADSWTLSGRRTLEVVGVAADVTYGGMGAGAQPRVYVPLAQHPYASRMVVRTAGDPLGLVGAIRAAVRRIDDAQPVYDIETLEERIAGSLAQDRVNASLLTVFAVLALAVAASGLYGLLSYVVSRRTRDIGIRMALGASRAQLLGDVARRSALLTVSGLALGLIASLSLARVTRGLLYGVEPTDLWTHLSVCGCLAGVAVLATYVPARRAARVDPVVALGAE